MAESSKITDIFKQTKLWLQLKLKAHPRNLSTVEDLIDYATPLLDRIIETFPTYTLHNGPHQLNVLNRMGDLLGDKITDLSDLEIALLILSTFYHDIGMVFSEEERENLRSEPDFSRFLSINPKAFILIAESDGNISIDIAEWYCRWSHAKRVWKYLDEIEGLLVWDGVNFKKQLGEICQSHNEDIEYLKNNIFATDFWGMADLRFCAILLRLSDILDFDNSRSPVSVYKFLKLEHPETKRDKISHGEWEKHLASQGFSFANWSSVVPYDLDFRAAPTHPAVENDIQEFLNIIEVEFQKSSSIVKFCCPKLRDFIFPERIKRNNIHSQGYKFGYFKFTLDQEQILDLLMGENLYESKFVFIRELLQNAIDTSRHRIFHEHNNNKPDFEPQAIEVSTWVDSKGFRWIRMDDFGMGMTEKQIRNYLLKVGNSYYRSDEFKVNKLRYNKVGDVDFTPVSRFGIGLLSCFIVSDQIEINTRSIECDLKTDFPIRMSLKGLHNFYVIQTGVDVPSPFPGEFSLETGYRKEPGTSIALKIKADQDILSFDLENLLKINLINPQIKVLYKTYGFISNYPEVINQPLCKNQVIKMPNSDIAEINNFLGKDCVDNIKIHLIPVDISKNSKFDSIKGQIVTFFIEVNRKPNKSALEFTCELFFYTFTSLNRTSPIFKLRIAKGENEDQKFDIDLIHILDKLSLFHTHIPRNQIYDNLILSHNGIVIINKRENIDDRNEELSLKFPIPIQFDSGKSIGIIQLKDEFRPDMSISRDRITDVNWNILSVVNYVICQAIKDIPKFKSIKNSCTYTDKSYRLLKKENFEVFSKDKLVSIEYWGKEKIFISKRERLSIEDVLSKNEDIELDTLGEIGFERYLMHALIQKYCNAKIKISLMGKDQPYLKQTLIISKKESLDENLNFLFFKPLTFVEYLNFEGLVPIQMMGKRLTEINWISQFRFFNINHPYSQWFIRTKQLLDNVFSGYIFVLLNFTEVSQINTVLEQLRKILPDEYKPEPELILREEDFMFNG